MDKRERLVELINFYADGSQAAFCRKTGMEKTAISRMVSGQLPVSDKQIAKISAMIPEARAYLEGQTELPRPKTVVELLAEREAEVAELKREIAIKNRTIDALLSKAGF